MLIAARNKVHNQKFKAQLKREFDMKDLRKAKKILVFMHTLAISGELRSQSVKRFYMIEA